MRKPRHPTPEELALWRESNRHTNKLRTDADGDLEITEPTQTVTSAPAHGSVKASPPDAKPSAKLPRVAAPLPAISAREATKRFKPHREVEAQLDLHGLDKLTAYAQVHRFLTRAHKGGLRHVIIITGKGRGVEIGVLRSNLPHWLNEPALRPLISAFTHARPEKGGHGVTHVLLKRL